MKIKVKTDKSVDLDVSDEGIRGHVKLEGFELEIDATWVEIEAKFRSLHDPVPKKARGQGRVSNFLAETNQGELGEA